MKKVYMIGNTHFDPVWLWTWDEAMSSITATFRSALDRMNEYPEFKYSFSCPAVFEWIKKTSPGMFDEIKRRVAEGRWELSEGWWVQPDCMTPSGEGLVRQGLYGQRYLMENFGRFSDTVFNIDSFGHPATLPQILRKSRIKYYVFCRPESRHIALREPLFNWKSADGSCVLTYRDDSPYKKDTAAAIASAGKLPYDSMQVYGVTDHGGAPTIESIEEIRRSDNALFSTVSEFFDGRKTDYTVERELITGDFGVYANHTGIKACNRKAEYALLNAEKTSVIAESDDRERLTDCWHDVLFNQFHDILGGACIKEAYTDADSLYGRAISTANEIIHYNLLKVTNNINMPGRNPDNAWNIVVWNLNSSEYDGYIEAEVQWAHEFPWYDKGIALEDGDGKRYECRIIRERSVIPGFRSRFLFKAKIPSVGYKAFKVIRTEEEVSRRELPSLHTVKTDLFDVTLSQSGGIEGIFDKSGRRLSGRLMTPVCYADDGDTWAFNTDGYGGEEEPFKLEGLETVETNSLRTIIKATLSFKSSRLEMYYSFYERESYIDIRYRVNWNEKHRALKLITDLQRNEHTVSIPYGSAERGESRADVPMGEWIKAGDLTVSADRVFAYNVCDKKLGLTVLRSPIYGDLRIAPIDMDADYDIMEQGIGEGKIRICLDGEADASCAARSAAEWSNPPIVMCESNHKGSLPSSGSFMSCETQSVVLTAMKKAEDGDGIVVRGVECDGRAQKIRLCLNGNMYEADVAPHEIFTLLLDEGSAKKVNLLEEVL